ncbi:hypothetical protein [Streptomyces halstedii]|uniref:hypothetical protein n=1 Tax=Streptomyces halstedii TaxID=1944 RepID=UPI0033462907
MLQDDLAYEARVAAAEFAEIGDEELLAREAELDQRWATVREKHQQVYRERRKVQREKRRLGLSLRPLLIKAYNAEDPNAICGGHIDVVHVGDNPDGNWEHGDVARPCGRCARLKKGLFIGP